MSTQRTSINTFKLTIAVGLGLSGVAGVALVSGGSTLEPLVIQEAMAAGPDGGTDGGSDFTWGNGMTGQQFKKFGGLLCSPGTQTIVDAQRKPSAAFADRMEDGDFRGWFHYIVRDGVPAGTTVTGWAKGKNGVPSPIKFTGEGGLTFSWLSTPLTPARRGQVLAATAAFVNDRGPENIARFCSSCSGIGAVSAAAGAISRENPKITGQRKSWLLELAFVGQCGDSSQTAAAAALSPRVKVFWSERLRQALGVDRDVPVRMRQDLEGRVCSAVYKGAADRDQCPFAVVGRMEDHCRIEADKGMTCKVATQTDCKVVGDKKETVCTSVQESSMSAVYTFIEPKLADPRIYRLPR